jgi:SAM-dependent methyltransferase
MTAHEQPDTRGDQTSRLARVRTVFDDWAHTGQAEEMADSHAPFSRRAFERFTLAPDSWYLDIGCGNGYTVRWAAAVAPQGRAVGIDLSPAMIERARALSDGLSNVEFHLCAFPEHPLPRNRFDAVFSMEVLYYLPDLHGALEEVERLLSPTGTFACAVDYYAENPASHTWPDEVGLEMTLLDAQGWRRAFEQAGLDVTDQFRVRLPPEEASQPWKAAEGSLVTMGRRR